MGLGVGSDRSCEPFGGPDVAGNYSDFPKS